MLISHFCGRETDLDELYVTEEKALNGWRWRDDAETERSGHHSQRSKSELGVLESWKYVKIRKENS